MTLTNKNGHHVALLMMLGVAAVALMACSDSNADDEATTQSTTTEAAAEDGAAGGIEVAEAWARATAGNPGENTAIYAIITNNTSEEDVLVGVRVGEDIATRSEVHETVQQGENMVMQEVEGGLALANPGMTKLEPGGYHAMLMNVPSQLTPGQTFPSTFIFEKAGEIEVPVEVREASSMGN